MTRQTVEICIDDLERIEQLFARLDLKPHSKAPKAEEIVRPSALHGTHFDAFDLYDQWRSMLRNQQPLSLAEAILFEQRISLAAPHNQLLRGSGLRYTKTLQTARERAAIYLYDYARSINWRRPVVFQNALKASRTYLVNALHGAEYVNQHISNQLLGKLGVATTLLARFTHVDRKCLAEAHDALKASIEAGNTNGALEYYLELSCYIFDEVQNPEHLARAIQFVDPIAKRVGTSETLHFRHSEAFLRLSTVASSDATARQLLQKGREHLSLMGLTRRSSSESRIAYYILDLLIDHFERGSIRRTPRNIKHLRVPFCARGPFVCEAISQSSSAIADSLLDNFHSDDLLAMGIYADLLTRNTSNTPIETLKRRLAARKRHYAPQVDTRTKLFTLRDTLLLSSLTDAKAERRWAISELLKLENDPECKALAIYLLANDLEIHGPLDEVITSSRSQLTSYVEACDFDSLYRVAASSSINSPDLVKYAIGGRSNVETIFDYHGLATSSFMFKSMSHTNAARENSRAERIAEEIDDDLLKYQFRLPPAFVLVADGDDLPVFARRYIDGEPASLHAQRLDSKDRLALISRVASFLGLIHRAEGTSSTHLRKELKQKELRRWLKAMGLPDPNTVFSEWFSFVEKAPSYQRRDAHLGNWIVGSDGSITAIDFEATFPRPIGYEVAQITDDKPLFDASDWASRRSVFTAYATSLGVSPQDSYAFYEASVAARCIRRLTLPEATHADVTHAMETLNWLCSNAELAGLRNWCASVLDFWMRMNGFAAGVGVGIKPSEKRRQKVSKALSYHLRHSPALHRDGEGWVDFNEVIGAISPQVSLAELEYVATHPLEPRFEIRAGKIRARYGHSHGISGSERTSQLLSNRPKFAYHATGVSAFESIVELSQGLKPMRRQFVHLGSDLSETHSIGTKRGQFILLRVDLSTLSEVTQASPFVLLTPHVPLVNVQVEPLVSLCFEDMC